MVEASGASRLPAICGIGPIVAAKILGATHDVDRFATAAAFAAHAGVSPAALLDSGARTASRSSASTLDPRRAARRVGDG